VSLGRYGPRPFLNKLFLFSAMAKILIGFLSALIGFTISPQVRVLSDYSSEVIPLICSCLMLGVLLSISSAVNGHDVKMFIKSKVDFIVNVFVSSFIGCSAGLLIMYVTKFLLVGRWVFGITSASYVLLVFIYTSLVVRKNGRHIVINGKAAFKFLDVLNEIGSERLSSIYVCRHPNLCPKQLFEGVGSFEGSNSFYLAVDLLTIGDLDFKSPECSIAVLDNVFSVDLIIESELEVVPLKYNRMTCWWEVPTQLRMAGYKIPKRALDLLLAVGLSLIFLPLMIVASILVKIVDGGPVFYKQIRLGQYARPFTIWKLKTMKVDSEKNGAEWAKVGDSRVTKVGKILRKSRIDELPQLWNVFRGDMSLIGPRPERPEFYSIIEKVLPEFSLRLCCKPGLTGWAQVNYPYGASIHDSKVKLMYDLYYIKGASLVFDIRILTRTIVAMVKGAR
jgi:lipopolysaccharide/colanic/teichoic acid biosynthesis glycosyltransferase